MSRYISRWWRMNLFDVALSRFPNLFIPVAATIGFMAYLQRQKHQSHERTLLEALGNPGFSPAAGAVMQLYREGKLIGDHSILRGKNLMGANWRKVILPEVNLEGINLRHADLREAWLQKANLTKADFYWANLSEANLGSTHLVRTNFMRANLQKTILSGSRATGASFFMAHAQRAYMRGAELDHVDFQEADLHGADLERARLSKSSFRDTNLARANLKRVSFRGVFMVNANLTGANLSGASFDNATILPDAEFVGFSEGRQALYDKYWTSDTDMTRYTDPNYIHFWQPKWVKMYDWVKKNYEED